MQFARRVLEKTLLVEALNMKHVTMPDVSEAYEQRSENVSCGIGPE